MAALVEATESGDAEAAIALWTDQGEYITEHPFTARIACSRPVDYNGCMNRPTSIPQHIWDSFSDEARAIVPAVIDALERQVAELRQQLQDLQARLDQNSTNSSRPPSTDPIAVKRKPPKPPSKKRRGAQQGHPR